MTTPDKAFDLLMKLLMRGLVGRRNAGLRLPPGRCACHEPTVKWCGRHGEPRKRRATVLA